MKISGNHTQLNLSEQFSILSKILDWILFKKQFNKYNSMAFKNSWVTQNQSNSKTFQAYLARKIKENHTTVYTVRCFVLTNIKLDFFFTIHLTYSK